MMIAMMVLTDMVVFKIFLDLEAFSTWPVGVVVTLYDRCSENRSYRCVYVHSKTTPSRWWKCRIWL
jgi:hypothetical protein